MNWFGADPPDDIQAAKALIAAFAGWRASPNPGVRWGLQLKGQAGLIGSCGLFAWNRDWRKCTIGYELAPETTGQGLMHEALERTISWGFEHVQLNRIEAQVHAQNTASLNLLKRLGFQFEGNLRELGYWAGRHHDLQQFSLLVSEWQPASRKSVSGTAHD